LYENLSFGFHVFGLDKIDPSISQAMILIFLSYSLKYLDVPEIDPPVPTQQKK
jgi:hypothetical protein